MAEKLTLGAPYFATAGVADFEIEYYSIIRLPAWKIIVQLIDVAAPPGTEPTRLTAIWEGAEAFTLVKNFNKMNFAGANPSQQRRILMQIVLDNKLPQLNAPTVTGTADT